MIEPVIIGPETVRLIEAGLLKITAIHKTRFGSTFIAGVTDLQNVEFKSSTLVEALAALESELLEGRGVGGESR